MPSDVIQLEWDKSVLNTLEAQGLYMPMVRAMTYAGRDAVRAMRTAAHRAVRQKKKLKVKTVTAALSIRFPKSPKSIDGLEWSFHASGEPIPLATYPTRVARGKGGKRGQLYAQVNVGKWVMVRSAFEAIVGKGEHRGIFRRVGASRYPIKQLYSSSVGDAVGDALPQVEAVGLAAWEATLARTLPMEVEKALERRG